FKHLLGAFIPLPGRGGTKCRGGSANLLTACTALLLLFLSIPSAWALTLEPLVRTFEKEGGGAAIIVTATASENWTASTTSSWINITPVTSGPGSKNVSYIVSANRTASQRTGTITIGGQTHTVYQNGYTATINPTEASYDLSGGTGSISVVTDSGIAWDAKSNNDWITITAGASGSGIGSVGYSVAVHTNSVAARTGTLTLCDKTFTVTQTGTDILLSPTSVTVDDNSNIALFNINALSATAWTVTPKVSWISLLTPATGAGDASATLVVMSNMSYDQRIGTVTVGSKTFTVTQNGNSAPLISIDPPTATAVAEGAYGLVNVYATPDYPWTATSQNSWLTVTAGESGKGDGNVQYVV
ncbi:MAG: hypothetical protein EOM52_13060, partial [Clostridia bacterium]|nr:hypothetical protein [Clostridia bacterium]